MSYTETIVGGVIRRTIKGPDSIEDTLIGNFHTNNNYGGNLRMTLGRYLTNTYYHNALFRITASSIPSGNISAVRLKGSVYLADQANSWAAQSMVYKVRPENDWVAGSTIDAIESNTACWSYCKYNSQAWAGSAGCNSSGIDYYSDASPPIVNLNQATSTFSVDLPPSWFIDFRDGTQINNGIVLIGSQLGATYIEINSTQNSNANIRPYFEIDYTALKKQVAQYNYKMRRR